MLGHLVALVEGAPVEGGVEDLPGQRVVGARYPHRRLRPAVAGRGAPARERLGRRRHVRGGAVDRDDDHALVRLVVPVGVDAGGVAARELPQGQRVELQPRLQVARLAYRIGHPELPLQPSQLDGERPALSRQHAPHEPLPGQLAPPGEVLGAAPAQLGEGLVADEREVGADARRNAHGPHPRPGQSQTSLGLLSASVHAAFR